MKNDVDKYFARVPEPARSTLNRVREVIRSVVPPGTTEEISYGIPTFKCGGGLVAIAAFRNHCSFFPMSSTLLAEFKDELEKYKTSKGTIQFPVDKPLPATLVKNLVKARLAEQAAKVKRSRA